MPEEKDGIDKFFDWVDKGVDKYVGKMSQVRTLEKDAEFTCPTCSRYFDDAGRCPMDGATLVRRNVPPPPLPREENPNRQLLAQAAADIVVVEDDDARAMSTFLHEVAGLFRQRSTSAALPERSRNIALANCANAESLAEEIALRLSQGYHLTFRK